MASWTYVVQANKTFRIARTRTLCNFPLLIGEILRRADLRLQRQARRRARLRKIGAVFGNSLTSHRDFIAEPSSAGPEEFINYLSEGKDQSILPCSPERSGVCQSEASAQKSTLPHPKRVRLQGPRYRGDLRICYSRVLWPATVIFSSRRDLSSSVRNMTSFAQRAN